MIRVQISEQKLSRIDLNLLISLSVLLKERSVSKAAERLYLSQSAMSRTLQRLREVFDDPLFHRTSTGIIPTIKAKDIEAALPDLLQKLESIFQDDDFNPSTCHQHFSISIPTLMSQVFLLPLIKQLSSAAPSIKLSEYPAKINPYDYLESGSLDFAIHVDKTLDKNFSSTDFGNVKPVIFARKEHPLLKQQSIKLGDCFNFSFLDLLIDDSTSIGFINPIDLLISKQGFKRDIHFQSSQLSILTTILKDSDHLLIGPHFLLDADNYDDQFSTVYQFEQANAINLYLLEHNRVQNSAAHQWFKQLVLKQGF